MSRKARIHRTRDSLCQQPDCDKTKLHVWFGPAGVRSSPHYDVSQNFFAQVEVMVVVEVELLVVVMVVEEVVIVVVVVVVMVVVEVEVDEEVVCACVCVQTNIIVYKYISASVYEYYHA